MSRLLRERVRASSCSSAKARAICFAVFIWKTLPKFRFAGFEIQPLQPVVRHERDLGSRHVPGMLPRTALIVDLARSRMTAQGIPILDEEQGPRRRAPGTHAAFASTSP